MEPHQFAYRGLTKIAEADVTEYQRFLLADCFETYLQLSLEERKQYNDLVENSPSNKVRAMNKTHYDRGLEEGIKIGKEQGELHALRTLAIAHLERKFQSVPDTILRRVEQMSKPELNDLTFQIPTALKLEDLFPNG